MIRNDPRPQTLSLFMKRLEKIWGVWLPNTSKIVEKSRAARAMEMTDDHQN
jgi:hypothetical protein